MGADIYLQSKFKPHHEVWEPRFHAAVEARNRLYPCGVPEGCPEQAAVNAAYDQMYSVGYFRDSYNSTSLFWLLDLSWWGSGFVNDKGKMGVRAMKTLLANLESQPITDELMSKWVAKAEGNAVVEPDGPNSVAAWREMFERKRLKLMGLLREAIDLKEPLDCSC